jgi:hypothetical protein
MLFLFIKQILSMRSAAKKVYGTSLANVDFLHGWAEFLLTLTNLFIVLGLRNGIREEQKKQKELPQTPMSADNGSQTDRKVSEQTRS